MGDAANTMLAALTSGDASNVAIISPHFDDAPLSLGQSMTDGLLAGVQINVVVVFSRSAYTAWPVRRPLGAPFLKLWRPFEETRASRIFGYRWSGCGLADNSHPTRRSPAVSRKSIGSDESIRRQVQNVVSEICRTDGIVFAPAGVGSNTDHLLVAEAAAQLARNGANNIAFYEDRPYAAAFRRAEIEEQIARLGLRLERVPVSGPFNESTRHSLDRCYPSQANAWFTEMLATSVHNGLCDQVWVPARCHRVAG